MLEWKATKEEYKLIKAIVDRAWGEVKAGYKDRLSLFMDLEAVHSNGCPLDFEKLLAFEDGDFYHDIWGIRNNINRNTGKLGCHFLPRCAKPTPETTHYACGAAVLDVEYAGAGDAIGKVI